MCLSVGRLGSPSVGIASNGTLVGGGFRRSSVGICKEREDAEELEGESSVDGDKGGTVSVADDEDSLTVSFEKRALKMGLGDALGTGVVRVL